VVNIKTQAVNAVRHLINKAVYTGPTITNLVLA